MNFINDSLLRFGVSLFLVLFFVILFSLGIIVIIENCIVMIVCIRNLKFWKNIYYNLVFVFFIGDLFFGVGVICMGFCLIIFVLFGVFLFCIGNVFL